MSHPTVSILLTSYNHQSYIEEAINSVLGQTFSDYELVVWDDGSTDRSWELIQGFHDPRIRTHRNSLNACGRGLNSVFDTMRGKYLAIHHSDDRWSPTKLAQQVKLLDNSPDVGACFTHVVTINHLGSEVDDAHSPHTAVFNQDDKSRHEWLRHLFFRGNAFCHPSALIRRECFQALGPYNEGLFHLPDYHMWVRLCLGFEINVIPERLTHFRTYTDSLSSMSSPSLENRVRHHHEMPHALEAFRSISLQDLVLAFPESKAFEGTPHEMSVVDYMLAMTAIRSKDSGEAQRSFGANLLTRCWMDDAVRDQLYSIHGLTRHQLRDPDLLVDHSNCIAITNLTNKLQEISACMQKGCQDVQPALVAGRLFDEIRRSASHSVFKSIQASIPERSFHLFNHILYDIRTLIGDRPCTYLEIGSYCGASALLMLSHPMKTDVICIDPLCLPPSHFNGTKDQDQTLYDNLSILSSNKSFEIIKSFSQDPALIAALYSQEIVIDMLFIDGDHGYASVISDFLLYEPLVRSGGYIVFDDYNDSEYSPDVHHAVNALVGRLADDQRFVIVGAIPDLQGCSQDSTVGNEFVLYKR
jgi:predicted O-methyltransferase YrrM